MSSCPSPRPTGLKVRRPSPTRRSLRWMDGTPSRSSREIWAARAAGVNTTSTRGTRPVVSRGMRIASTPARPARAAAKRRHRSAHSAWYSGSRATNASSAATAPAISSLPTLKPRPKPWRGTPFSGRSTNSLGGVHEAGATSMSTCWSSAEATRSRRPRRNPLDCGPRKALPPLMQTRSAPSSTKRRRFWIGGTHDHRQPVAVRHLRHHPKLRPHTLHRHVRHGHRTRTDARLDLFRLDLAYAHSEGAVEEAHLDEASARHLKRLVVGVAVMPADHDLGALLPSLVRHAIDAPHVEACDARARGEGQRAEGARGDQPGLGAGVAGDDPARRLLELFDGHRASRRLAHGLERFGAHDRAAESCQRARGVDHGPHPEPIVDGHGPLLPPRARST